MVYLSKSEAQTKTLASTLAKKMTGGEIVTLSGELGAGKTVFAKGFARGLGIQENVPSPTFTIMNDYRGKKLNLYHYDAYRLTNSQEAYEVGLTEFFGDKTGVCLVEWASNICDALVGKKTISVEIRRIDEVTREIIINDK